MKTKRKKWWWDTLSIKQCILGKYNRSMFSSLVVYAFRFLSSSSYSVVDWKQKVCGTWNFFVFLVCSAWYAIIYSVSLAFFFCLPAFIMSPSIVVSSVPYSLHWWSYGHHKQNYIGINFSSYVKCWIIPAHIFYLKARTKQQRRAQQYTITRMQTKKRQCNSNRIQNTQNRHKSHPKCKRNLGPFWVFSSSCTSAKLSSRTNGKLLNNLKYNYKLLVHFLFVVRSLPSLPLAGWLLDQMYCLFV